MVARTNLLGDKRQQDISKNDDIPFEEKMKRLVEVRIMTSNIKTNELLI